MKQLACSLAVVAALILMTVTPVSAAGYKMSITIDHTKVVNEDQVNFPLYIHITDPALRSTYENGHMAKEDGKDISFTLADGKTALPHEIVSYNSYSGEVKAWVAIPTLSSSKDTELFMCYGGNTREPPGQVWDKNYTLVRHLQRTSNPDIQIPDTGMMDTTNQITVQAWVYGSRSGGEALQPLVSKWAPSATLSSKNFSAYDASDTGGLNTRGYFGAVFDGRYIYFSPQRNGQERDSVHGYVLRYDTHGDFKEKSSWESFDAGNIDGLETRGHYGAVFDGRYVIFVPRGRNYSTFTDGQTRVLRYDTHLNFKDKSSWSAYDLGFEQSHQSAGFDGKYIYFSPGYEYNADKTNLVESPMIIRFDARRGLKDPASYATFDVREVSPLATGCYDGVAFDGKFMYFIPLGSGVPIQYDTTKDFKNRESWKIYDARPIGMKQNVGASFDGRYLYYDAYGNTNMIRYDTKGDFANDLSWTAYDATLTPGFEAGGFDGGFFDGRFIWFAPFTGRGKDSKSYTIHCQFLRYDTQKSFHDKGSWDSFDAGKTDGLLTGGYNAGAFDGRYFYMAPWRYPEGDYSKVSSIVLRCDTLADGTGSYSLRYCDYGHNGGLNAAVPGPSFIVNTVKGPVSIFANEVPAPGWHYLTGVYNGSTIKLFIDGVLVNERPGTGAIQNNKVSIDIGHIQKGNARFEGLIDEVRISNIARNDNRIKTEYNNIANPATFIRTGKEEALQ